MAVGVAVVHSSAWDDFSRGAWAYQLRLDAGPVRRHQIRCSQLWAASEWQHYKLPFIAWARSHSALQPITPVLRQAREFTKKFTYWFGQSTSGILEIIRYQMVFGDGCAVLLPQALLLRTRHLVDELYDLPD